MKYTDGSVTSFAAETRPAYVTFIQSGKTLDVVPLVGWATIADNFVELDGNGDEYGVIETHVEPMVLVEDGRFVTPAKDYANDFRASTKEPLVSFHVRFSSWELGDLL